MDFSANLIEPDVSARVVALFNDGTDIYSIVEACKIEPEEVLGHLLGVSLTIQQLTLLKDMRTQIMSQSQFEVKELTDLGCRETKGISLANIAWKLSQLLEVEASKVQHLLGINAKRSPIGPVWPFNYCTRTYSYVHSAGFLSWTNLATGTRSSCIVSKAFRVGSCWVELPSLSLLITGGSEGLNEAWIIDVLRQFAVIGKPAMLYDHSQHSSVFSNGKVYVISGEFVKKCERYDCNAEKWEAIPDIPVPVYCHTAVAAHQSIFVFGGEGRKLIQELKLASMDWLILDTRLPYVDYHIPCFVNQSRPDSIFFVSEKGLYEFDIVSTDIVMRKSLGSTVESWYGQSHYVYGTLYCSSGASSGYTLSMKIF